MRSNRLSLDEPVLIYYQLLTKFGLSPQQADEMDFAEIEELLIIDAEVESIRQRNRQGGTD